jgi:hypothetical protein
MLFGLILGKKISGLLWKSMAKETADMEKLNNCLYLQLCNP